MKRILVLMLFFGTLKAQVLMNVGPSYWGMHITNIRSSNVEGFSFNPAQLAVLENSGIALMHCVPYNIASYRQSLFAATMAIKHAGWGLVCGRESIPGWSESRVGLAYGRDLGNVQVGVQFNYFERNALGYAAVRVVYPDLGFRTTFSNKLCMGFLIQNAVGGRFWGSETEKVATLFRIIAGYQFSDLLHAELQIQKTVGGISDWKVGLQYNPVETYVFKLGFAHVSNNPFLEVGWHWQQWIMAIGGEHHLQLGMSYGLSMRKIIVRKKARSFLSNSVL